MDTFGNLESNTIYLLPSSSATSVEAVIRVSSLRVVPEVIEVAVCSETLPVRVCTVHGSDCCGKVPVVVGFPNARIKEGVDLKRGP